MQRYTGHLRTELVFGVGALASLAEHVSALRFRRVLLVADPRIAAHTENARRHLQTAGTEVFPFEDFSPNPDSHTVERGRAFAAVYEVDSIVAIGGGSAMDCAKGINFVLTNGGRIEDYWGYGKAAKPMLPSIGIPTTTGTGSEAQSYAVISHGESHRKLACGDPKAAFRVVILDPELAVTQPVRVRAASGYDALAHAVETLVTTKQNVFSLSFAREAWRLLSSNYERCIASPSDLDAVTAMQLGAHWAGVAIEHSMLGAAHACANPLTQFHGTLHAEALSVMLPHVVRWNWSVAGELYEHVCGPDLPNRLRSFSDAGALPTTLSDLGVSTEDIPKLALSASEQWTGRFNPRPFDHAAALELYQCAL